MLPQIDDVEIITTDKPKDYSDNINQMISKLTSLQEVKPPEVSSISPPSVKTKVSFLEVIRSIRKADDDFDKGGFPSVNANDPDLFSITQPSFPAVTKDLILERGLKTPEACDELMSLPKLRLFFKCMADPACAFATDSASEFLSHLETAHPNALGSGHSLIFYSLSFL